MLQENCEGQNWVFAINIIWIPHSKIDLSYSCFGKKKKNYIR